MPTAFQLDATARNGTQQTWPAEVNHDAAAHEWRYRVSMPGCNDFYEARFKEVGVSLVQPDVLDRHDDAFRGKGITEALFAQVVGDSGRTLISSTNGPTSNFRNEYRSADAERVWRRLFAEERAEYDANTDRFTFYPQGLPPRGVVRRANAARRPQFYVKGSYVLDVLFGTNHANDIDICWLGTGGQPTNARIVEWMQLCGLAAKPIQLVRVTDLFACDGGGAPIFNIDLWRIDMDGAVYAMAPATHIATKLNGAPNAPLTFLPNPPAFALAPSHELNVVLGKALTKMGRHASLNDQTTVKEIQWLVARQVPP